MIRKLNVEAKGEHLQKNCGKLGIMSDIKPEMYEVIAGKINNLLKNFKLLNEKHKNSEAIIEKLEKKVEFLEGRIDFFCQRRLKSHRRSSKLTWED